MQAVIAKPAAFISYLIARSNEEDSVREIVKHVLIVVIVIVVSRYVGYLIGKHFQ